MSSAVQALLDGDAPRTRHNKRSAYRAMSACCAPDAQTQGGKSQRQTPARPTLAWRTRLALQQTQAADLDDHASQTKK